MTKFNLLLAITVTLLGVLTESRADHNDVRYREEGGTGRYQLSFDRLGHVLDGSAVGDNYWYAVGGFRSEGNLVVMFQRDDSTHCSANLTHFYRANFEHRELLLDYALDKCGTLHRFGGKRHIITPGR